MSDGPRQTANTKDSPAATSALHVIRTTLAATASLAIAHALALPEPYWATISTIVAVQSSLVASWNLSWRRFAGTALGAAMGAALASLFAPSGWLFSLAMFAAGLVCMLIRLDRAAYRFASITLAIVILASHGQRAWITAGHRFIEVAIGIAIGLVATAVWPERTDNSSPHASSPRSTAGPHGLRCGESTRNVALWITRSLLWVAMLRKRR